MDDVCVSVRAWKMLTYICMCGRYFLNLNLRYSKLIKVYIEIGFATESVSGVLVEMII